MEDGILGFIIGVIAVVIVACPLIGGSQDWISNGNHITCDEQCTLDITKVGDENIKVHFQGSSLEKKHIDVTFLGPVDNTLMAHLREHAMSDDIGVVLDETGHIKELYKLTFLTGYDSLWKATD